MIAPQAAGWIFCARRAAAGLAAAGLAAAVTLAGVAAPRGAAAAESDPEVQLIYRPPAPEQSAPPRKEQRAFLEFTAVLLYENARYWIENSFVEDWQFELSRDDQASKYLELEGVRFDSNDFTVNWTHAYAGGIYYTLGRANNLGVKESFLLAAFESLYWECVVEWREVFAVNDMVTTAFGALAVGEPWYQLARYLSTRSNPVTRALGFIHPVVGLHAALDPGSAPPPTAEQSLPGYGVSLSLGAATTAAVHDSDSGSFINVGLQSRLALAPGFTTAGTERRQGWDVLSSTFNIGADIDEGTVRELDVSSGAVFYGRLERGVRGDGQGGATILGFGSAFTLFRKAPVTDYDAGEVIVGQRDDLRLEEPRDFRDKYALVHLFGPVYEGFWRGRTLGVSWALEAYPDFGLVNAYALNAYSADNDIGSAKTTLMYHGYYYGYGASAMARLAASAGPVTLGVAASLHYHESIEGLDRYEDEISADVHAADTWYRFGASLGVSVPGTPLAVEASGRWSHRRGTMGETAASGTESRYTLGITCRL